MSHTSWHTWAFVCAEVRTFPQVGLHYCDAIKTVKQSELTAQISSRWPQLCVQADIWPRDSAALSQAPFPNNMIKKKMMTEFTPAFSLRSTWWNLHFPPLVNVWNTCCFSMNHQRASSVYLANKKKITQKFLLLVQIVNEWCLHISGMTVYHSALSYNCGLCSASWLWQKGQRFTGWALHQLGWLWNHTVRVHVAKSKQNPQGKSEKDDLIRPWQKRCTMSCCRIELI